MLRSIGDDLWLCDGPVVRFMRFFPYPTRMAVVRLRDGGLWVWSPIALSEELVKEIESLGAVRHLVAPNALHHLSLAQWSERFPGAQLHAAPGLAAKRPDLCFQTELGDDPDPAWASEIDQVVFRGSFFLEEVVFFHRPSSTALVTDLIQRFDALQLHGPVRWIMRLWGLVGENGSTPREWRASFWKRRAAREALRRALAWNPARLVIAHGVLPAESGREALARGLRWLGTRPS
ncbi:MAG: DUF4336 domain-containing protein [Myxococcota bacterium]